VLFIDAVSYLSLYGVRDRSMNGYGALIKW